ncbi:hypothetical protein [Psychrobacter sp. DAB_AL43B]|uniref:hypothetical protein n=1 Tax=Psychrobacter sp. DAB_AL43B TaxID=1028416 RepID=UPI0009A7F864|nr:hypothetical protein [Psychrobacter sp. DAB_AL43B]SLJ84275.1 hypothetical protein DABAL43B_1077 [Psychrobacter sp. DAB_AL43B]
MGENFYKNYHRETKYIGYSLALFVFLIFVNGCEKEPIITGNKQNPSTNIAENIEQDNLNNENKSLVFEINSNINNESIQTNDSYTKVILEKEADLDMDGDSDFISVVKPKEQDDRNFDLEVSVYRMVNKEVSLWQQNTLMFKDPINGCMMNGLEEISTSSGKFIIEYTSCYDNKYAKRFVSFSYDPQSDDFKVTKNIISFFNSESNEMNQTFNCKDNGYLFSSYNDDCEWL